MMSLFAAMNMVALSAQAQTLVDVWSYAGGGLSPASYPAAPNPYRPPELFPDADADSGASILVSGMTSGGLGSSSFPEGYGGIYTFFSANPSFTLQTDNVLAGVETITVSFLAGGGTTYDAFSLTLDYNLANPALVSTSFVVQAAGEIDSPIGPVEMTLYSWTWDVSALGTSSEFATTWTTNGEQHMFYDDINLTQAVPEPSVFGLIGLGSAVLCFRRRYTRNRPAPLV